MLTIDADAHVLETEQTWESMDGAERKYRPRIVEATGGESKDEYIKRSVKFGIRSDHKHLIVPAGEVARVTRLGEVL